jgi:hypothetical protein
MPDGCKRTRRFATPQRTKWYGTYRTYRWRRHFWGVEFPLEEVYAAVKS